ncbi:MAG: putative bifunctional diguanylate cyclase/phosphodiesterase [Acidimicrobiales bacterium]
MSQDGRTRPDHPESPPARARLSGQLRVTSLTVLLWLAATAVYLLGVRQLGPLEVPVHVPWWVLSVVLAVAYRLEVHVHVRRDVVIVNTSEVPLVLGLIFTPAAWLPVAAVVGAALYCASRRMAMRKAAFNTAVYAFSTSLALVVFRLVLGGAGPLGPRGWGASFGASLTEDVLSGLAVAAVVTLATGQRPRSEARLHLLTASVPAVVNTSFALVGAYVLWLDPRAAWLLLSIVGLFFTGYRAQTTLRRRYSNLEALYEFTRAVGMGPEHGPVTAIVLRETARLLRADRAELTLASAQGRVVRHTLGPDGKLHVAAVELEAEGMERAVLRSGTAVLLPRAPRGAGERALLARAAARDLLAAPVRLEDGMVGVLLAADRIDELSTFDRDDLRLFETLANHASTTLRSDRLLGRLRQEATDREHRALHDPLTALPNRTLFQERANAMIAEAAGATVGVILIDLARFKEVNDTLGHANGDLLLKEVAGRLGRALGRRGVVARLGGDEFAVALPLPTSAAATQIAEELQAALRAPFELEELPLEISASAGIALSPLHGDDAATLLQRADVAMYSAKTDHRGIAAYSSEQDHYSPRRLALVGELRQAIDESNLTLHYQPIADLRTAEVVGVEALVRWPHPRHGFLPPDEFIPIAEHTGLIHPLTRLVLDTALSQLARWRALGLNLGIAVNLSARSLTVGGLVEEVSRALERSGVPPASVTLELTESSVMGDMNGTIGTLTRLAELGVALAVDDFGTGYSSLSYLSRLPVDIVKIDKSFVQHMSADAGDAVIVRSTIDLARNLGLRVVAEGVEDRPTWERLRSMEADLAQGYLLAKPLPPARLEEWLSSYGGRLRPGRPTRGTPATAGAGLWVVPGASKPPTAGRG